MKAAVAVATILLLGLGGAEVWAQFSNVTPPAVKTYAGPTIGEAYISVAPVLVPQLELTRFRNVDGSYPGTAASAGVFGLSYTPGTSQLLLSEAANSNTKTDSVAVDIVLSPYYIAGSNITLTVNTKYTLGSGTVGTHTLASAAYLTAAAGTQGTTLIATAAQSVPATAGSVSFVITGTTLVPGSRLTVTFTMVIQDTGGSNITGQINSVTVS